MPRRSLRVPGQTEWSEITAEWGRQRRSYAGREAFGKYLAAKGWTVIGQGGWKIAYGNRDYDVVIKFDTSYEKVGRRSHAIWEYLTWKRARRWARAHLAKIMSYHLGLLVQERVKECRDPCPDELGVMELADRLKTSHWIHHSHTPDGVVYFDYDDLGLIDEDLEKLRGLQVGSVHFQGLQRIRPNCPE